MYRLARLMGPLVVVAKTCGITMSKTMFSILEFQTEPEHPNHDFGKRKPINTIDFTACNIDKCMLGGRAVGDGASIYPS